MRIKPNKTVLQGRVLGIRRAADGWGGDLAVQVESSRPAAGFEDFVGARAGSVLTVFAPEPGLVRPGADYTLTVAVIGGPGGERIVLQDAAVRG